VDALRAELAEVTGRPLGGSDREAAEETQDDLDDAEAERSVAGYLSCQPAGSEAGYIAPGPHGASGGHMAPALGLE
jgi:hypothetical protein